MNDVRRVKVREAGKSRGFIRSLVSPRDIGETLKPFVLLDHVSGHLKPGTGFGMHPHSGIATLTYHLDADVEYEDTAGQKGIIGAKGLEWMSAGGGTWHQGFIHPHGAATTGFQLWIALPPNVEDGPPEGIYLVPEEVPQVGGVRVLLGRYEHAVNRIPTPSPITYLDVALEEGERWSFVPPAEQEVGWVYVYTGVVEVGGETVRNELVIFEDGPGALALRAVGGEARFLLGTAKRHEQPLVVGNHSVHTNVHSLSRGEERIRELGRSLGEGARR